MEIELSETDAKGSFFIREDGEIVAEITWIKGSDKHIIVEHTLVGEKLKGQGIGKKLLDKVIGLARERSIKILPVCSYARTMFDRIPEYKDVLYK